MAYLAVGNCCPLEARIVSIENFKVKVEISNTNDRNGVCALKWGTMWDDHNYWSLNIEIWESLPGVTKSTLGNVALWNEYPILYTKYVRPLRYAVKDSDYELFKPQEVKSFTRDLAKVFNFKKNRYYFILIKNGIFDCYTPKTRGTPTCKARVRRDWTSHDGANMEDYFKAAKTQSSTSETIKDWKTEVGQTWQIQTDGTDDVLVVGPQNQKINAKEIFEAHKKAKQYVTNAFDYLQSNPTSEDKLFKTWFGSRLTFVRENFKKTKNGASKPHVYNVVSDDMCLEKETANTPYFGKDLHFFYICPFFFDTSLEGRTATIVHEMTHDSANTDDVGEKCYKVDDCKKMAAKKPESAIKNAENYALFAAAVQLQKRKQSKNPDRTKKIKKPKKKTNGLNLNTRLFMHLLMKLIE